MWRWTFEMTRMRKKKKAIAKQDSERNMTLDHRATPEVLLFAVLDCNCN